LTGEVEILLSPGKRYQWSIGTGAFTDVFKGKVRAGIVSAESTYVAVKLFRATTEEDPEIENTKRRLVRESNVWLRLDHPNIQPYLGHCSDLGPCLALISPLCGHGSIMKYLVKYPSAQRLQLVKEVAKGLEYLHSKQVIHADLHCKNILVDDEGNALLADFGRAKVIGEAGYSTALLAGSAPYMAPELFPSAEPPESEVNVDELFSKQSDVYAFAMVCFEIFTNEIPFASYHRRCLDWQVVPLIKQGKRPQNTPRVQSVISPSMWMVMEECWKQKPEARISAEEVVQRMDGF
jgi:serine/threonine protein kinase